MRIIKCAFVYFALVFGAGFILGAIRTVWVVPRTGTRTAELLELPFMILISFLAARFVVNRFAVPTRRRIRFAIGGLALMMMLAAEFSFVLWLRGMSIREYFATRDPVSATAYYAALIIFALLPGMVERAANA